MKRIVTAATLLMLNVAPVLAQTPAAGEAPADPLITALLTDVNTPKAIVSQVYLQALVNAYQRERAAAAALAQRVKDLETYSKPLWAPPAAAAPSLPHSEPVKP